MDRAEAPHRRCERPELAKSGLRISGPHSAQMGAKGDKTEIAITPDEGSRSRLCPYQRPILSDLMKNGNQVLGGAELSLLYVHPTLW